jgi:DNA-binding CsgD family transcriptional regulator
VFTLKKNTELTNMEHHVLKLYILEYSDMEIGNMLNLNSTDIARSIKNIKQKIQAKNIIDMVKFAHEIKVY